jgi:hypothetical protein
MLAIPVKVAKRAGRPASPLTARCRYLLQRAGGVEISSANIPLCAAACARNPGPLRRLGRHGQAPRTLATCQVTPRIPDVATPAARTVGPCQEETLSKVLERYYLTSPADRFVGQTYTVSWLEG